MDKNQILFDLLREHKWNEFSNLLRDDYTNKIDVNIRDNNNNYLIQYAIMFNKKEIVSLLINKGSRLDIVDVDGRCLLYYPLKYKYIIILEMLLHFNDANIGISLVDIKDKDGNTPLHYCIIFDDILSAKMLLINNADPNIKNKNGFNCLHLAVYKKNIDIVNLLIKTNININANTLTGETALHFACNFQHYDISKILLEKGADPNVLDYMHEISPIIYSVSLRNTKIFDLLLKYKADVNIQDYFGNTPLHYIIQEDDVELFDYIMNKNPLVNIYNAESKTPLHLALEKLGKNTEHYVEKLLNDSDLNIQNNIGNTIVHLLVATFLWKKFNKKLETKQLDIFIKNITNNDVLSYVNDDDKNIFIDMVCNSFLYQLKNTKSIWALEWEKSCAKQKLESSDYNILKKEVASKNNNDEDICFTVVKKFITEKNISIPLKNIQNIKFDIKGSICVKFSTFTGVTLDILIGLIYLLGKHKNICSVLTENFETNQQLEKYYNSLGLKNNPTTEYINFEIVWVYQKLFFPSNFDKLIKSCIENKQMHHIIIPIGIELHNGSHANYIIYDIKKHEIERFEPSGSHNPHKLHYNPALLDTLLEKKFKEINNKIKYIRPIEYLPKIGFQLLDIMEGFKFKKIGDPGGFCAAWTMWYVDMRLSNPYIPRKDLVNTIINRIKQFNYSFKNVIRNYSAKITELRDNILSKANLEINDWINDQFTYEQVIVVNNEIKNKIKNIKKYKVSRTQPIKQTIQGCPDILWVEK